MSSPRVYACIILCVAIAAGPAIVGLFHPTRCRLPRRAVRRPHHPIRCAGVRRTGHGASLRPCVAAVGHVRPRPAQTPSGRRHRQQA